MSKGKLIVISGASGVGKGTVLGIMMKKRKDLSFSVSATTRPPRPGETDGVHYYFISREKFAEMIEDDPLSSAVKQFAEKMGTPTMRFEPTVFLEKLKAQVGIVEYSNAKNNFPQSASALGKKIPRIQTALSAVGIDITQKKSSGKRLIIITRRF